MDALLIDVALKGTLLLLLAAAGALALRRASSAVRHLHWQLALAGLAALPLAAALGPRVDVPAGPLAGWLGAPAAARDAGPATARSAEAPAARPAVRRARPLVAAAPGAVVPEPAPAPAAGSPAPADAEAEPARQAAPPRRTILTLQLLDRVPLLPAAWAAGSALALGLLGLGLLRARALRRRAVPLTDPAWVLLCDRVRRELRLALTVELRRVPANVVPMTLGWRRPVVLLPCDADSWSPARRRHVLLHELAHVRRGDWLAQVLSQAVLALWWWQPLAWLAARELRRSREEACDDAVLAAGGRPSDYAEHLLSIASTRGAGLAGAAALAMARRGQLEGRLLAVLDERRRRAGPGARRVAASAAGAALLVAALACAQPRAEDAAASRTPAPLAAPASPASPTVAEPSLAPPVASRAGVAGVEIAAVQVEGIPSVELRAADGTRLRAQAIAVAPPAPLAEVPAPMPAAAPRPPRLASFPAAAAQPAPAPPDTLWLAPVVGCETEVAWAEGEDDGLFGLFGGDTSTWTWSEGETRWRLTAEGGYDVDGEGPRIAWLAEDASFTIERRGEDSLDRLQARPDDEGRPQWTGELQGADVAGLEPAAAADLLLRTASDRAGVFAEQRIEAAVRAGGPAAALELVRGLPQGAARAEFLATLLRDHELDTPDFAAALELAAGAGDEALLAELLAEVGPDALGDPELVEPLFAALQSMDSDAHAAETLGWLLGADAAEAPAFARGLQAVAASIESDAWAAEVLEQVPAGRLRDPAVRAAFLAALDTLESDAWTAEVLAGLVEARAVKGELLAELLAAAARGIESDAVLAELLGSLPPRAFRDAAARDALRAALETLDSDAWLAEVLVGALSELPPADAEPLLQAAAAGLDSDAYMAEVLEALSAEVLEDAQARSAFEAALATIESPSWRQAVLEAHGLLEEA